jgi:hypothetical protein
VYTRLLDTLRGNTAVESFGFDSIGLLPPDNPIVSVLGAAIQTAPDAVAGIRFSNNTINGQLVPDAYIYRLTAPAPERIAAG